MAQRTRSVRFRTRFARVAGAAFATAAWVALIGAAVTRMAVVNIERRYPPKGVFVGVTGGRLHVVDRGPVNGQPEATLVLLHGAGTSSADMMSALGERLASRYRVLGVDRPGSGWSDRLRSDSSSPTRQAAAISEVLQQLGIKRVVIVGHSWSGALATTLALDHPGLVSGLVLLSPVNYAWPNGEVAWYVGPATWPAMGSLLTRVLATPMAYVFAGPMLDSVFDPQQVPPDYMERANVPLSFRPGAIQASAEDLAALHAFVSAQSRRYREIRVPTTIVSGDSDKVVWTNLHSRSLARDIRGAKLVLLPGIGHMVHHAAPDAVAGEIDALAAVIHRPSTDASRSPGREN